MRNKRAKNTVFLSLFFLLYGILIYSNFNASSSDYMLPFVGIFMSGIFIINFGQFIPAWDSAYFPLLRTQPIAVKNYIQSKVVLMYCSVFILTILGTFYAYFGWDKVYLNVSCAVYNLGINIPLVLFFSAYNRKRIDLANASIFNYQGLGVAQWLVGIPLLVCPLVIFGAFRFMADQHTVNMVLMIIGIIGLLLQKVFLNMVTQLYLENRYKMVEGFKQKD